MNQGLPPVTIAYTNVKSGLESGANMHLLADIFAPIVDTPPAIIGFCEGRWWARGGEARARAERVLTKLFGVPYRVEIGGISRSDDPPAIAWRPDVFTRHAWKTPHNDHHRYSHNSAPFAYANDPERVALRVQIAHLDYASGTQRLIEAEGLACQLDPTVPNLLMADFNSGMDGHHGGDRDWMAMPPHKRSQKGQLVWDGHGWKWVKDTRALRTLLGPWDDAQRRRLVELGPGYRALAELDWEQRGRPFSGLAPTTITAQAMPIDHILGCARVELEEGSYGVHLNNHSDHGMLVARVRLRAG